MGLHQHVNPSAHQEQVNVVKAQILEGLHEGWAHLLRLMVIVPAQEQSL